MKYNQIYLDKVKRLEPKKDKVGALENRVGALEDQSPQESRSEPEPETWLEPLRLVPHN